MYYSSQGYRSCIYLGLLFFFPLELALDSACWADHLRASQQRKGQFSVYSIISAKSAGKHTRRQSCRETKERSFSGNALWAQPRLADRRAGALFYLLMATITKLTIRFKEAKKSFKTLFLGDGQILTFKTRRKILQFARWDQRHLNKQKLSLQKEVISIRDGIRKVTLFCSYNGHCSKVKIWSWRYWPVGCGCFRSLRHGSNSQRISRGKSLETLTQDVSSKRCIGFGKHDYENACKFLFRTLHSLGPSITLSCLRRTLYKRESGNSGSKSNGQYERVTIKLFKNPDIPQSTCLH